MHIASTEKLLAEIVRTLQDNRRFLQNLKVDTFDGDQPLKDADLDQEQFEEL